MCDRAPPYLVQFFARRGCPHRHPAIAMWSYETTYQMREVWKEDDEEAKDWLGQLDIHLFVRPFVQSLGSTVDPFYQRYAHSAADS